LNASVHLLEQTLPGAVHIHAAVPEQHSSTRILGTDRMGTGTILRGSGLVLTAHYLLIGADRVEVSLDEGRTAAARVVGVDFETGLGLLASEDALGRGLEVRPVEDVELGEECFLVASSGEGQRTQTGFVNGLEPFDAFWEFSIEPALFFSMGSPGLGGGPLVDSQGRMIGVSALSLSEVGRFTVAIPASHVLRMVECVERTGAWVPPTPRAWLGITCFTLDQRVALAGVLPDSPAEQAGLQPGDAILGIGGEEVSDRLELYRAIWRYAADQEISLRIFREGSERSLPIRTTSMSAYFS